MKHTGICLPGYVLKDGKPVKSTKRLSASEHIRRKKSKRVKVVKSMGGT